MDSGKPVFKYRVDVNKVGDTKDLIVYSDRLVLTSKTMQFNLKQADQEKTIMFEDIKQIDLKKGFLGLNPSFVIILKNGNQEKIPAGYTDIGKKVQDFIQAKIS